jgi:hypothetical protein
VGVPSFCNANSITKFPFVIVTVERWWKNRKPQERSEKNASFF